MKYFLVLFLTISLLNIAGSALATDYYSIVNGDASDKKTWNSSRDGKGTAPTSFDDPSDNFIVQKNVVVSNNRNAFTCKGSLFIEDGGVYNTGLKTKSTTIATAVAINAGGVLQLQKGSSLNAGFILIQGKLENLGGALIVGSAPLVTKR
jgi:hypothetical protein